MEVLVQFLKEENHVREEDDRHQLDITPGVIQIGHTFLHESSVAGKKIRFFGHLSVDSNQNILQDQKTIS
jgi:hypothetical protein